MRIAIIAIISGLLCCFVNAYSQSLYDSLDPIIAHRLPNADVGVVVADAKTGRVLYDHNGFQAFNPASNAKLLTTTAALYALGADYRFKTRASIQTSSLKKGVLRGNVWLTFSGDPSLTDHKLHQLIHGLKQSGIQTIDGNVIIDDTVFTQPNAAPGWSQDDLYWYYAAPITSVILNQNANFYRLIPSQSLGKPTRIVANHPRQSIHIKDNITTVTTQQANAYCALTLHVNHLNTIEANGCWPISDKAKTIGIALANPNRYAMFVIRQALKANHITLTGHIATGSTPLHVKTIATVASQPLKQLINVTLKDSDNVYAESLTKTLGKKIYHHGNFTSGALAITQILKHHAGVNIQQLNLADGSGLSRYDLITPRDLVRLLYVINQSRSLGAVIKPALPDAGENGTLSKRMQAFDTKKYVEAKTGSMHGISNLSGYVTTQDQRELIFVIFVNHIIGSSDVAKAMQAEILSQLHTFSLSPRRNIKI